MIEVAIRKAVQQDFADVLALIKEFSSFQTTPEKVMITLEQMEKEQDSFNCLVAELYDKEIIGFATYFFAWYSWSGKALYLDDLYVTEGYRKQGVGRKLLDTVIRVAEDNCCKKVCWQVSNWNSNAIQFYKKIGATIDDVEMNCDLILNTN